MTTTFVAKSISADLQYNRHLIIITTLSLYTSATMDTMIAIYNR